MTAAGDTPLEGRFGLIDDPEPFDLRLIKVQVRLDVLGEYVDALVFRTDDMEAQHDILMRL
jgi:hypothetical protein